VATHTNPELEARILANPDDLSAYLVYSDWLSEKGDPRGELIAVQAKLAETPNDAALKATEAKLLGDNATTWLGDLAGKTDEDLAVTWRLGFVDAVRIGPPIDKYGASDLDFPETIAKILALPSGQFIRELVVGAMQYDDYPTSWQGCIDALVEHGTPKALTRLEFNRGGMWDISSTELGSLPALYPHLKTLRELKIELGAMDLGTIDLPALRKLEIVTGGLTSVNLDSVGAAKWPNLDELSLCIGETDNDYGCNVQLDDVTKLLASENLGRVRHLGLANSNLADEIAAALPGTKILAQLETLDLSRGTFGDVGAKAILDNAAAFAHLKKIDLTHNYVSDELAAELAKVGPEVILAEREATGEDDRYVEISE
jgi:uncharacterized protein (TIGR02996 family)